MNARISELRSDAESLSTLSKWMVFHGLGTQADHEMLCRAAAGLQYLASAIADEPSPDTIPPTEPGESHGAR